MAENHQFAQLKVRWHGGMSGQAWVTREETGTLNRAWETMAGRPVVLESVPKLLTRDHARWVHAIRYGRGQDKEVDFRYVHRCSKHSRARCPGSEATHGSW